MGLDEFRAGTPYILPLNLLLPAVDYDVAVNANLGRNAHYGSIKALSSNTAAIIFAISAEGLTFSNYYTELLPGETYTLDGMDIHTIRIQSSVAGDDVIVEVH